MKLPTAKLRIFFKSRTSIVLFVIIFGAVGTGLYVISRASSPYVSQEAESGNLSGQATVQSDGTASGGKYIQYGTATASANSALCGTWALDQIPQSPITSSEESQINTALSYANVKGFSIRAPWNIVNDDFSLFNQALALANSHQEKLAVRFIAGVDTPASVFTDGAYYYTLSTGQKVPKPFSDTGQAGNPVFEAAYEQYVSSLASWALANNVPLIHLPWYGESYAELNNDAAVQQAPGYSYAAWLRGNENLFDIALKYASPKLAIEFPLSGSGPLDQAVSDMTQYIISKAGANNPDVFIQANGWGPAPYDNTTIGYWGSETAASETLRNSEVWPQPVNRGLQVIQPQDYDWTTMYQQLNAIHATYGEVFVQSFASSEPHSADLATAITQLAQSCEAN